LLAEKRPTTVIMPPSNCFPDICPVAGLTLILWQSAQVAVRTHDRMYEVNLIGTRR
jgi:hypothetical protein